MTSEIILERTLVPRDQLSLCGDRGPFVGRLRPGVSCGRTGHVKSCDRSIYLAETSKFVL